MMFTDSQINVFVSKVLHLGQGKREEYISQVDTLIDRLTNQITDNSSFKVKGFRKTGSLVKGTVLKPRGDVGVDADIAVFLDLSDADKEDEDKLHHIIRDLLAAAYPTKDTEDFKVQPRTLGIHFHESGLDVDLVPIIPIPGETGYGWQPSSQRGSPLKTSIEGQLAFIKRRKASDSRFRTTVRLIKHWRNEQELSHFRSFMIELIAAHLIDRDGVSESLESGIQRFFLYVAQSELLERISFPELGTVKSFPDHPVVILDPVNWENNVTMRLSHEERKEIVDAAQKAFETIETASWKDGKGTTLDLWREVMGRSFAIEE